MNTTLTRCALLLAAMSSACRSTNRPAPETTTEPTASQVRLGKWKIRDTRLFVRDVGPEDAPVLVVVHGGPGGNHLSQRPLEALAPGYRVVLYDQRGTGESDRLDVSATNPASLKQLTLEQNVADLEALRQRLGRDTISVIGHSWGAALAVFYAAAHPQQVEKLIVYSGGPETLDLSNRKRAAHMARLTPEEKTLFKRRVGRLQAAVKKGAKQVELDRLFADLAGVMFPALYCKRPKSSGDHDSGRGGFWANQVAGQYVVKFSHASIADKLREIRAPTLLTWGRCEPSPVARLTNLLDYLPDARFVVFEQSGHNAMEEQPQLFFETIRAFLAGKPLPMPAHDSREAFTIAEIARQRERLDLWGDRLTRWLYQGKTAELLSLFSPQMKQALPQDKFQAFVGGLRTQLGAEKETLGKAHSVLLSASVYRRVVRFDKGDKSTKKEITWTLTGLDQDPPTIAGLNVGDPALPAKTARLDYETKTELRLPVSGKWFVAWGGRTVAENYHVRARDQRFAYDLLMVKDTSTHTGDGSKNDQYYCFGQPVLAAGKGKVLKAVDAVDDRPPGKLINKDPLGNHVILDHGNGEYSFYCHLKRGSVTVKAGDRVTPGRQLGQCGNSGRSSEPHLHFHLQDTALPFKAAGIPAQFLNYRANGQLVRRGEPRQTEIVEPAPTR